MAPLHLHVVCRSPEVAAKWERIGVHYDDVTLKLIIGATSYYQAINSVIAETTDVALIAHDDVWISVDIASHVEHLVEDLRATYPNWAVVGNAGVRWDGKIGARHVSDPHGGPVPYACPRPALSVDGNLMLLNCAGMRQRGMYAIPDLAGFHGYDLVLSFEALRHRMCVLTDPRLFAKHDSRGNQQAFSNFMASDVATEYLSRNFMDYRIDTINGPVTLDKRTSYSFLEDVQSEATEKPVRLLDCYDASLEEARKDRLPSLAICIRTQFKRPALLERMLSSVDIAIASTPAIVAVTALVVTDQPEARAVELVADLQRLFPDVRVDLICHRIAAGRASRVDLALAAFAQSEADAVWFVDDDDYVLPTSITTIGRSLADPRHQLLALDCTRVAETWEQHDGTDHLIKSVTLKTCPGSHVFDAFTGDNSIPFCGLVFPRAAMWRRLQSVNAHMSYYEDYFLLLVALGTPSISVEIVDKVCCGISIRGHDNTVTETDRTVWDISIATVLSEVLSNPALSSQVAWQTSKLIALPSPTPSQVGVVSLALGSVANGCLEIRRHEKLAVKEYGSICGWVDHLEAKEGEILVRGWSVDRHIGDAVEEIIVCVGDKVVCTSQPHLERPDVARDLGISSHSQCGFSLVLRVDLRAGFSPADTTRVYGVSRGLCCELRCASREKDPALHPTLPTASQFGEAEFDEQFYLRRHSDVRAAVARGEIKSGFLHFVLHGADERRSARFLHGCMPSGRQILEMRRRVTAYRKPFDYFKNLDFQAFLRRRIL